MSAGTGLQVMPSDGSARIRSVEEEHPWLLLLYALSFVATVAISFAVA